MSCGNFNSELEERREREEQRRQAERLAKKRRDDAIDKVRVMVAKAIEQHDHKMAEEAAAEAARLDASAAELGDLMAQRAFSALLAR